MAISRALSDYTINFKVSAPTGDDASSVVDNLDSTVLLEEGESYSQTITLAKDTTDDAASAVINAVIGLCSATHELANGADLTAYPVVTKKIINQFTLINE